MGCGSSKRKLINFKPDQKYSKLKRKCDRDKLFEDPEFVPSNDLLCHKETYYRRFRFRESEIEWLRPGEICSRRGDGKEPQMVVGARDRFDIIQGEIGDCWFLAPLAILAENDALFSLVVPPGQDFGKDYAGIFRFRFYRFGKWEEVVIDDRLPTRNGHLIYLKAKDSNEFWSPLVEKAYAKLYGSYAALEGGVSVDAAVDFTGGIPEVIDLTELSKHNMSMERLFHVLKQASANNAIITCAIGNARGKWEAVNLGLQDNHAYTITKVVDVRGNNNEDIPLIRLRNPHGGEEEWKGDWADNDQYWQQIPEKVKKKLGLTFENDGEFYMNFNRDFVRLFGKIDIVWLTPTYMDMETVRKFKVFEFEGKWERGSTAAGCGNDSNRNFANNPQFRFKLTDPDHTDQEDLSSVVVAVAQKSQARREDLSIGFRIYQVKEDQKVDGEFVIRNDPVGSSGNFINMREVSARMRLKEGSYCVMPSTFQPRIEGEFIVRVFVEKRWGSLGKKEEEEEFEVKEPVGCCGNKTTIYRKERCGGGCFGCQGGTSCNIFGNCCGGGCKEKCREGGKSCRIRCKEKCCMCSCPLGGQRKGNNTCCGCKDKTCQSSKCCQKDGCCKCGDDGDYYKKSDPKGNDAYVPSRGKVRNIPITVERSEEKGKVRKRDMVMMEVAKRHPNALHKILKLKDFYKWCLDSKSELALLKRIVNSILKDLNQSQDGRS